MTQRILFVAWAAALCATTWAQPAPEEFFEQRVRPLLARNCFTCHTTTKLGGLEMKSREALLAGGNSGPAVTPGKPDESLLIRAVTHTHERLKMPPEGRLKDTEVADLKAWIRDGAAWPASSAPAPAPKSSVYTITPEQRSFWAFQPVRKPAPPKTRDAKWGRSPIDQFILGALEEAGMKPPPPATKRTLLRRATFDLTGLPPSPEEVAAFLNDSSPDAFAKVVDRLLASPRYGERWGRYWLDVARYSDDKLDSTGEVPHPNAWRYRDWVIQAFNDDMPFDLFAKAQLAGDQLPPAKWDLRAGLGFHALRPEQQDDRIDATTRGFLGLTVACAQCHDHKFDPIPTKDYYSLQGVFDSTAYHELPLAAADVVERHEAHKKKIEAQEKALAEFLGSQGAQLAEILAAKTARYLMAARVSDSQPEDLDAETLNRWRAYLKAQPKDHPFLKPWDKLVAEGATEERLRQAAEEFQALALAAVKEKKEIEEKNLIRLGGSNERRDLANADLLSLERDRYFLWRDMFSNERVGGPARMESGLFYYRDKKIDRFLHGEWKTHAGSLRARIEELKKALPEKYPFLHVIQDSAKPADGRVAIRGERGNLGEVAPRRFLSILSKDEPPRFAQGSGRKELAEAIADPRNPLTPRVMANRVWQHHFGQGIVRTPSNFGRLGERPSHPELLDYLASRLVESGWSVKALHREILLSAVYAMSSAYSEKNYTADPDNRKLWRFPRQRLDVEAVRDAMLLVSGELDDTAGGPPIRLTEEKNRRRTVYGFVSRKKLDPLLAIFDFPNPNTTSEQRIVTHVPLQRLFFLNSAFVMARAEALARRLQGSTDAEKVHQAYRLLFGREPEAAELKLGLDYVRGGAWAEYAQALLGSNEFLFLN